MQPKSSRSTSRYGCRAAVVSAWSRLTPFRIGYRDLVGDGRLQMRHQGAVVLVACAGTQLAGQLAVERLERAVVSQQPDQPVAFAGVGGGGAPLQWRILCCDR